MEKKKLCALAFSMLIVWIFIGCASQGRTQVTQNKNDAELNQESSKTEESQLEKFQRLYAENYLKLKDLITKEGSGITIESVETVFQPKVIYSFSEINEDVLINPGQPYYFKLRAIYKGYDENKKAARLQDLGNRQSSLEDASLGMIFGIDSTVNSVQVSKSDIAELPAKANSIATFYLTAIKITEDEGRKTNETIIFFHFIFDVEEPYLNPENFIVVNGMHFITVEDARVPNQEDIMKSFLLGGAAGSSSSTVFDPISYSFVDLMDARVAMDKKDVFNEFTFPTVRVKYVSEVLFLGQSGTTLSVSTDDKILTERMTFTGRVSAVSAGEKVRIYYTIAKDPLEKWEIQAIERL